MDHLRTLLSGMVVVAAVLQAQPDKQCTQVLVVNALDERGVPVQGLSANAFRASSRGNPITITSAQFRENVAARAVVLLDSSGSMSSGRDSNKWKIALTATSEFISAAPPAWQVSFMTFADSIKEKFSAAGGREAIQKWLKSPEANKSTNLKGKTALFDTIRAALNELQPAQTGDAIFVITDGGENNSAEKASLIERELHSSATRLFVFMLNDAMTSEEQLGAVTLYDLARRSGGSVLNFSPQSFETKFPHREYEYDDKIGAHVRAGTDIIGTEIGSYYVLAIRGQVSIPKPEPWKLELLDAKGHKRKNVNVTYPSHLPRCVPPV